MGFGYETCKSRKQRGTGAGMTIVVKKMADGGYEVVSGQMRMKAALSVNGKATVQDVHTGLHLEVHEVGGQLLALTKDAVAAVESAAEKAIAIAAKH